MSDRDNERARSPQYTIRRSGNSWVVSKDDELSTSEEDENEVAPSGDGEIEKTP
ncbi:hypothetical protein DEV91_112159 [Phyllobacterium brassicacearum]|nr:hypothetical protein DEV91_112159 [Phyllobacterium brassicacearum]